MTQLTAVETARATDGLVDVKEVVPTQDADGTDTDHAVTKQ